MLHEERFEHNPSKKWPQRHSSMQEFRIRLSHVWRRLPLLKVLAPSWLVAELLLPRSGMRRCMATLALPQAGAAVQHELRSQPALRKT